VRVRLQRRRTRRLSTPPCGCWNQSRLAKTFNPSSAAEELLRLPAAKLDVDRSRSTAPCRTTWWPRVELDSTRDGNQTDGYLNGNMSTPTATGSSPRRPTSVQHGVDDAAGSGGYRLSTAATPANQRVDTVVNQAPEFY